MASLPDEYCGEPRFQMVRLMMKPGSRGPALLGVTQWVASGLLGHGESSSHYLPRIGTWMSHPGSRCLPSTPSLCVPHSTKSSQGRVALPCKLPTLSVRGKAVGAAVGKTKDEETAGSADFAKKFNLI